MSVRVLLVLLVLGGAMSLGAQQSAARAADSSGRARLEGELRQRFARLVRERVGLSDEQMRRLAPFAQSYEQQRRRLQLDERNARTALRQTMRDYQAADSTKVDRLLRSLVEIQKRRAQLLESEQRDLATVMTPPQRARYMALQEQIRRRMEQMRNRRAP